MRRVLFLATQETRSDRRRKREENVETHKQRVWVTPPPPPTRPPAVTEIAHSELYIAECVGSDEIAREKRIREAQAN